MLPQPVQRALEASPDRQSLLEVVLDLGRIPEARYPGRAVDLGTVPVERADLAAVVQRLGAFGGDNRAGIERTLHRISAIRNRTGDVVGLTCRVGRAVFGTVVMVRDLLDSGRSLLLMGRPGVGKTTALREIARVLADELGKRVVVIDTSNEIAGDGDIPHPAIGRARRMQVARPELQHQVMIEAVENHMPEVIVIDEIGTELEAQAARTIAERGVMLVATAHGNALENLIKNPTLSDLVGGIQSVTLGDEEARRRRTQKTVLERAAEPTFPIAVEMHSRHRWLVHADVARTVDLLLRGQLARPQVRELGADGRLHLQQSRPPVVPAPPAAAPRLAQRPLPPVPGEDIAALAEARALAEGSAFTPAGPFAATGAFAAAAGRPAAPAAVSRPSFPAASTAAATAPSPAAAGSAAASALASPGVAAPVLATPVVADAPLRVYGAGLSRTLLEQVARARQLPVETVPSVELADVVLSVRQQLGRDPHVRRQAQELGLPILVIKSAVPHQVQRGLERLLERRRPLPPSPSSRHQPLTGGAPAGASGPWEGAPLAGARGGEAVPPSDADDALAALEECRLAVERVVLPQGRPVELLPRSERVRQQQAELAARYRLRTAEFGRAEGRRLRVFPA